jgi:RNA polymerase sigma-70 factor (sigma-E family)
VQEPFEEYVTARSSRLLRFAYVLCGDRYLAEDLVQNVLAKAHRRWSRIEAEQPDGYVRAAVVREYLSWRRRLASTEKVVAEPPEPGGGSMPDFAQRHAVRDELWRLLAGLPRTQRAVLVLRFYEDLDDRRIAEVLGCAPATVRVHASRALGTLRAELVHHKNAQPTHAQPTGESR